ncbi:MAG: MurR/RpiR family transcriptional regulator [Rhizobiaceae bacterium]|nr:MurR/RpiR family transcriptional regulator [Rhizobiaceae bacterium]
MGSSVAELIAERIDSMPAGERRAAQTLIAAYPVAGLKTVAEFSQLAGVSSPTVLRFVARLGFANYPAFQSALQEELAAQLQSPASRTDRGSPADPGSSPLAQAIQDNIRETFRHLSDRQIQEAAALIAVPKARVYLIGGRFTDAIARYMAAHLGIIRPGVLHLDGQESNWQDRLLDIGKGDVLIVFDIRRYQESLHVFSEKAAARGAKIVLLTDQWLSPVARLSRHVIAGRTSVPSPWDSATAILAVAEALIAAVTQLREADSARRLRDLDRLR